MRLQPRLFPRSDDLACLQVAGFESSRDFETLMRAANEAVLSVAQAGSWVAFEYGGYNFRARMVPDDYFEEGQSIDIEEISAACCVVG